VSEPDYIENRRSKMSDKIAALVDLCLTDLDPFPGERLLGRREDEHLQVCGQRGEEAAECRRPK
jgi:hypothetical protein